MARGGRKRILNAERYPSGGLKPKDEISPIVAKRMLIAAAAKMGSEEWGTVIGRYYLTGQLTEEQYRAGKTIGNICELYSNVMYGPKPPSGQNMEKYKSQPIDVDSYHGEKEAERHILIIENYNKIKYIVGSEKTFNLVKDICSGMGIAAKNYEEFIELRECLKNFVSQSKIRKKK